MIKNFVLDTNVLIHDPASIFSFGDNNVILPITVIEELDGLKKFHDERGKSARSASRRIDGLRKRGSLVQGVKSREGGTVKVLIGSGEKLPDSFASKADNTILSFAVHLNKTAGGVVFISKDINMRIKAQVLGLETEDYDTMKVNFSELYNGWREIEMSPEGINKFYSDGVIVPEGEFLENEYLIMKNAADPKQTALARFKKGKAVKLLQPKSMLWGVKPLNVQQTFAIESLMDDKIKLVAFIGIAGTGKTLLALAGGLSKVFDDNAYRKLLISRPVIAMGKDIGYLPGTKEEKLAPWMRAIYDNLEFLVSASGKGEMGGEDLESQVDWLFSSGKIEVEALTYIRGRSIPKQFMIVDEAQNLTPHELKTIVSRAGEDTKIVLTGDPYQIDNPYLDASSNGLTYIIERFKGQEVFSSMTFVTSERSPLARLAAELL
ncbi:MAG: phosphate starvation-inducible protein PhoH [Elusimicrobia bacterium HGW-Elusimicrobia-2]|nr:MAG: phosphate starvation-inducible protein PhoH [Elusimicrobia bacterium HGW-Elusimicrobia-2]